MTPARAREIWRTRGPFGTFSVTAEEDAFVREVWRSLPGNPSWTTALLAIANP